jgi:hypothetical protein
MNNYRNRQPRNINHRISTQDKYERVERKKEVEIKENEIRCKAKGRAGNYISYALRLFDDGLNTVLLKATGGAMNTAVRSAEIIRRRIKGLH